jgi:hypothetical protein
MSLLRLRAKEYPKRDRDQAERSDGVTMIEVGAEATVFASGGMYLRDDADDAEHALVLLRVAARGVHAVEVHIGNSAGRDRDDDGRRQDLAYRQYFGALISW